jgi:hypothetical protein
VEIAPDKDNEERIAGLKLINPETIEAVTRPHQSILMDSSDIDDYPNAPLAESGGAAAWLQDTLETDNIGWGQSIRKDDSDSDAKIGFRRDEIIPLTRDADVGEVFGTSRIEAVSDRVDGIKQKLSDNDEAIASKAYPLWLFLFGTPEEPWDADDISQFMKAQEMENFHPGMKQGVRGDMSVETISGDVADIAEYLQFDLRWIMSAMPMPIFVLGAFESASVGQVSGIAQQQDVNRQIKEARRELEEEFTPIVREVAKQQGVDSERAKNVTLKFGKPGETDLDIDRNEQVIRYISGSQGGQTQTQKNDQRNQQQRQGQVNPANAPAEDTSTEDSPPENDVPENIITRGETPESINNPTPDQPIAGVDDDGNPFVDVEAAEDSINGSRSSSASGSGSSSSSSSGSRWGDVWATHRSVDSLNDSDSRQSEIARIAEQVFRNARDRTLRSVEERYSSTPQYAAAEFENVANRELNQAVREARVSPQAKSVIEEELGTIDAYNNRSNHFGSTQNVRFFAQNVENAVRDAAEEMLRRMRLQVRNGVVNSETWHTVRKRVEEDFNDDYLRERANLIGHMELKNAVESTKLQSFESDDDVVGVRVTNDAPSTPLTQELAGTKHFFDDGDITETLRERASAERKGFDPLPRTPPFHFNDTTTLEPLYE